MRMCSSGSDILCFWLVVGSSGGSAMGSARAGTSLFGECGRIRISGPVSFTSGDGGHDGQSLELCCESDLPIISIRVVVPGILIPIRETIFSRIRKVKMQKRKRIADDDMKFFSSAILKWVHGPSCKVSEADVHFRWFFSFCSLRNLPIINGVLPSVTEAPLADQRVSQHTFGFPTILCHLMGDPF